ncbi:hypothetical protein [Streptomyces roseoverticillatus]|uniref:Uncharacterized protein n=1 Tax=Streptomyces roseoverticillatus TaxID=66429 RepID=A0ABV3J312_9ACTN
MTGPGPRWAYSASPTELDAVASRSLVVLARHVPARQVWLLTEAEGPLCVRSLEDDIVVQRSALLHSAWLALADTRRSQVQEAITCDNHPLDRLPTIASSLPPACCHGCTKALRRLVG